MSSKPAVISRRRLSDPDELMRLDLACREWGVFYLVEHGIGQPAQAALLRAAAEFFALPQGRKDAVRRTRSNAWGYFDDELTKNTRDWKEVFDFGPDYGGNVARWPEGLPAFRQRLEAHYRACEDLALDLLCAVSCNLGVGASFLLHDFQPDHSSFLRLNYYPVCPEPAAPAAVATPDSGHLGVNHHTDSGALTLLLADEQPGLEAHVGGRWRPVAPMPGALIVNLGDVLQVWSNDRYRAPLHRVRSHVCNQRFSVPFFLNPRVSCDYAPLSTVVSPANPARYSAINWGEFRAGRAAGDFADGGEEIQIDRYRI